MAPKVMAMLAGGLVCACMWSAPPTVEVHGKVMLSIGGGVVPKNRPPGWTGYHVEPAAGATVIFASRDGTETVTTTDSSGAYRLRLASGLYFAAASGSQPVSFLGIPVWVQVGPDRPLEVDLGAIFSAA